MVTLAQTVEAIFAMIVIYLAWEIVVPVGCFLALAHIGMTIGERKHESLRQIQVHDVRTRCD